MNEFVGHSASNVVDCVPVIGGHCPVSSDGDRGIATYNFTDDCIVCVCSCLVPET